MSQTKKTERDSSAPSKIEINRPADGRNLGAEMDVEALAALPAILREAEGKPEYPKLWWAWSVLSSATAAAGGLA